MRRILMIMMIFLLSIYIFADNEVIIREGPMEWRKPGGNPSGKSFQENIKSLKRHPSNVREAAIKKWEEGDSSRGFATFSKNDTFEGSTFGGKNSGTTPIVWYGTVTIVFEEPVYSKYVDIYVHNEQIIDNIEEFYLDNQIERYQYHYFGDGYAGKEHCGNLAWKYELIEISPVNLLVEEQEENEALDVVEDEPCEPDTVWMPADTVRIECERPLVSFSGWVSHAQDHFAESTPDSIDYGDYYYTNLRDSRNGQLIWSLLGNITGKLHLGTSWSLVTSYEAGYNDGPLDWKVHVLGIEKDWNRKFYLQFGPEYRYREYGWWTKEITNWIDPYNYEFKMQENRISIFDLGCYLQMDWFNMTGDNHLRAYFGQEFRIPGQRIKIATSELQLSAKLELAKWYIFGGFKYQNMPLTVVDGIYIPLIDHLSFEPRIGYSFHQNWILFFRYRNIRNRTFEDINNPDWSTYSRNDYGGGLFYRPKKLLGIRNLYAELVISDSHIKEEFKNSLRNSEEELMEVKLTFFYHWKQ